MIDSVSTIIRIQWAKICIRILIIHDINASSKKIIHDSCISHYIINDQNLLFSAFVNESRLTLRDILPYEY